LVRISDSLPAVAFVASFASTGVVSGDLGAFGCFRETGGELGTIPSIAKSVTSVLLHHASCHVKNGMAQTRLT